MFGFKSDKVRRDGIAKGNDLTVQLVNWFDKVIPATPTKTLIRRSLNSQR